MEQYCALVVDDEPLPREYLAHLLAEAGVGRVLQAANEAECLAFMGSLENMPDWVFLDIQMPALSGLGLADTLATNAGRSGRPVPAFVFVTGYEEYAVQAFDRAAVDYLLKPVERERLAVTLRRLSDRSYQAREKIAPAPLLPVLQRLPIRLDYAVRLVDYADIIAANSVDKRVEIITREASYLTNYSLSGLEQRLPAEYFVRAHDSWIVNLSEVQEIYNLGSQTYQLRLRTVDRLIPVSRRRLTLIQQRLGL